MFWQGGEYAGNEIEQFMFLQGLMIGHGTEDMQQRFLTACAPDAAVFSTVVPKTS